LEHRDFEHRNLKIGNDKENITSIQQKIITSNRQTLTCTLGQQLYQNLDKSKIIARKNDHALICFLFFSLDQLLPCWRGEANELATCEHQVTYWGTTTAAWPRTAFFSLPVTHFASDLRERKRNQEVGVDFPVPVK
jgi:hypothetical protein